MELFKKLQEIQSREGYLPMEELEKLPCPMPRIISTASFYDYFRWEKCPQESHIENLYPVQKRGILLISDMDQMLSAMKKAAARPEEIIPEIKASLLRGRGGGGFPVWRKWELVKNTAAGQKYVVCNAGEGEPGTGKDRALLTENPEAVITGMAICAIAVGADKGILYLRAEYGDLKASLEKAISSLPSENIEIELCMGMGPYACGEETALLESIEGNRGEPRDKPPLPGVSGLYGMPTVINNAETFACVPYIIAKGAESFRKHGTETYPGTKLYTVSGCLLRPGIYELDAGTTAGELLALAVSTAVPQAIQIGGGSGSIVYASALDLPLDADSCLERGLSLGTGAVRFIGEDEDLREYVTKLAEFFAQESCGICVPCRNGLRELVRLLQDTEKSKAEIMELAQYIKKTSRCALGKSAVVPVISWLERWF